MDTGQFEQEKGNYNVFCQSCGRIVAVNVGTHEEAISLEKDHTSESDCRYSGTHRIEKST